MSKNYYKSGSNNAICDVCGFKHKAVDMRMRWDGLFVCRDDFEQRQPQDFVKAITDKITVPISRPRQTDAFITTMCSEVTRRSRADIGTADCSSVNYLG
jgi:hypothetical protein